MMYRGYQITAFRPPGESQWSVTIRGPGLPPDGITNDDYDFLRYAIADAKDSVDWRVREVQG